MSILLDEYTNSDGIYITPLMISERILIKAQAIHTVKYMESPCTEHLYNDTFVSKNYHRHRYDCEICRADIYRELGI